MAFYGAQFLVCPRKVRTEPAFLTSSPPQVGNRPLRPNPLDPFQVLGPQLLHRMDILRLPPKRHDRPQFIPQVRPYFRRRLRCSLPVECQVQQGTTMRSSLIVLRSTTIANDLPLVTSLLPHRTGNEPPNHIQDALRSRSPITCPYHSRRRRWYRASRGVLTTAKNQFVRVLNPLRKSKMGNGNRIVSKGATLANLLMKPASQSFYSHPIQSHFNPCHFLLETKPNCL